MDISYEKAVIPEMYFKSFARVALLCLIVLFVFYLFYLVFGEKSKNSVVIQNSPLYGRVLAKKTKSIILCFNKNLQLENLNLLLVGDPYDQLFNVPVNPNLRETGIDGTMATKKEAGSKVIYKIDLPIPAMVREIIVDMGVQNYENLIVFFEDDRGDRIWEQSIKLGPGRYHKIPIRDRDIYIWT